MQKIKVNRNILWAETLVAEFVNAGIKYACISPGSRSTPLTYAFATNKKVKSYAIIDERSSGFFALGLVKATNNPVVLVCTSGTAAAEFYPAPSPSSFRPASPRSSASRRSWLGDLHSPSCGSTGRESLRTCRGVSSTSRAHRQGTQASRRQVSPMGLGRRAS